MRKILALVLLAILPWCFVASKLYAQNTYNAGEQVQGRPFALSTKTSNFTFSTSGFSQILPSTYPLSTSSLYVRQELTINNPNPAHSCWFYLGLSASATSTAVAQQLNFGQSYHREWPIVPDDAVQVFCQAGDSIYVDYQ